MLKKNSLKKYPENFRPFRKINSNDFHESFRFRFHQSVTSTQNKYKLKKEEKTDGNVTQ